MNNYQKKTLDLTFRIVRCFIDIYVLVFVGVDFCFIFFVLLLDDMNKLYNEK